MSRLDAVLRDNRFNSAVAWVIVATLVLAAAASVGIGEPAWAVFAAGGVAVSLLPAVLRRDPSVMAPWEILAVVALPIASQFLPLSDPLADLTTFLAVLAVGLLVVVEIHVFSPVEMTARFAVVFVVLVTMATAGVWAIVQQAADVFLGTTLIGNKTTLMWDLVFATAIGILASPVLALYFRWIDSIERGGLTPGERL